MILLCFRWDYYTGRMPQLWRHLARNMMDLGRSSRNNMWWYSLGQVFSLRHVFRIAAPSWRHGLPRNSQRDVIWNTWPAKQTFNRMVLKSVQFHQDLTLSTRILDGAPRDNQRDTRLNVRHVRKTLASFYWILWGPIRTSLFPQGSRMGAQGTTKGTKKENVWQVENP